jgi:glutamyl-tRNA synthetase
VLRNEDLDRDRCKPQFVADMLDDLRWFGFRWNEGPDAGGPFAPYTQSQRLPSYRDVWKQLHATGLIYPSPHSRKDVERALLAPHDNEDNEPIFPAALRPPETEMSHVDEPGGVNWRFRVPDGRAISFVDGRRGLVTKIAGENFGDFLVWRKDGFPSYELAVVADDHAMQITEVVRGEDLLTSTARQILLYEALGWQPPAFYHCELVRDEHGNRLAKRAAAVSLHTLRKQGCSPDEIRNRPPFVEVKSGSA